MRVNNLPKSYRRAYGILFVLTILELCVELLLNGVFTTPDTLTYITAGELNFDGVVDLKRTPVYPCFLELNRLLFGNWWQGSVIFIQFIAFTASAYLLRELSIKYTGNEKITFIIVAFFCLSPSSNSWVFAILTECLSIFGVILFIWFLTRALPKSPSKSDIIGVGLTMLFLIMLRPIFIYLLLVFPIYFIVLAIILRRSMPRSVMAIGAAVLIINFGAYKAYCYKITQTYEIHSVSIIPVFNNYFLLRESGVLSPEAATDDTFKELLLTFSDNDVKTYPELGWTEFRAINNADITPLALETYVNNAIKANPKPILARIFGRLIFTVSDRPILFDGVFPFNVITMGFIPTFSTYWVFIIILACLFIAQWKRTKIFPIITFLLLMISCGITLASSIGAMAEWGRLVAPGLPALLLLTAAFCSLFKRNSVELK